MPQKFRPEGDYWHLKVSTSKVNNISKQAHYRCLFIEKFVENDNDDDDDDNNNNSVIHL
jgi:hypothetical protein